MLGNVVIVLTAANCFARKSKSCLIQGSNQVHPQMPVPFSGKGQEMFGIFCNVYQSSQSSGLQGPYNKLLRKHGTFFILLISDCKKTQLNPTLYEHHKLFMNNWSLPSISKFFWFDISHALCNKGPAKRTQHFNAKSFNIVARKRVAHFWPRLAHVWPPYSNMLQHVGWFWIKFWIL